MKKNNPNKLVNYEINWKSLLDPTLLINTFNDLQRYYKSITIYYGYNIETKEEIQNSPDNKLIKYSSIESFNPAKIEDTSTTIELKDLKFNKDKPQENLYENTWYHTANSDTTSGMAYNYFFSDNRQMPYELIGYNFNLSIFFGTGTKVDESYENKSCISMSIVDNNLSWIFYRTSPRMYLWRKQWNWMSSIILFKLKNNVLHI
ncbi:hypothetical protein [Spiroplasma endosymbiont of Virgichneumon dumeticola]|uniref:hypothetical protein n=1 Tax=Spiroplasma endosymbiont of Virgichneumon dumeticola TaxID=3139323 RepID=UPI0035C8A5C9